MSGLRWCVCAATMAASLVCRAQSTRGDEPPAPADVTLVRGLRYRENQRACTLDLAMPKRAGGPWPAIVVIHGGGWIEGDKSSFSTTTDRNPANILDFAALGIVAVTINYRLAGEAPYPAALDDCRAAIRWLRAHAADYHLDPARVGAYGNSAGGHLALLLGLTEPPPVDAGQPHAGQSSRVQAVVSDSGPLDLALQHRQNQLRTVIEKFMGGPPEGARLHTYQQASPSEQIGANAPPLLLLYGEVDGQVDVRTADRFVEALGKAGHRDVSYFRLAQVDHCPHSLVRIAYLRQVVNDFFVRALGPARPRRE